MVIFSGKNPLPLIASANDIIQRPLILSFNGRESDLTDFSLSAFPDAFSALRFQVDNPQALLAC